MILEPNTTNISTSSSKTIQRCGSCKKKIGLVTFSCRCGGVYCAEHRADTTHNCSYDYQSENKSKLSTVMLKISTKKIDSL